MADAQRAVRDGLDAYSRAIVPGTSWRRAIRHQRRISTGSTSDGRRTASWKWGRSANTSSSATLAAHPKARPQDTACSARSCPACRRCRNRCGPIFPCSQHRHGGRRDHRARRQNRARTHRDSGWRFLDDRPRSPGRSLCARRQQEQVKWRRTPSAYGMTRSPCAGTHRRYEPSPVSGGISNRAETFGDSMQNQIRRKSCPPSCGHPVRYASRAI